MSYQALFLLFPLHFPFQTRVFLCAYLTLCSVRYIGIVHIGYCSQLIFTWTLNMFFFLWTTKTHKTTSGFRAKFLLRCSVFYCRFMSPIMKWIIDSVTTRSLKKAAGLKLGILYHTHMLSLTLRVVSYTVFTQLRVSHMAAWTCSDWPQVFFSVISEASVCMSQATMLADVMP